MKATYNGITVEGTPQEITDFIKMQENKSDQKQLNPWYQPYQPYQPYWNQQFVKWDLNKITCYN